MIYANLIKIFKIRPRESKAKSKPSTRVPYGILHTYPEQQKRLKLRNKIGVGKKS